MNIQMQLAGVGILLFLILFYLRRKSVGLYTEVFFKWTMIVTLVNVSLDILSIVAIANRSFISGGLCFAVCRMYLISLIWTGCCGLFYICQDIYNGSARVRSLLGFGAVSLFGNILVLILPIGYYHQGREIYTYGPSVVATYIFCLSFVILTLLFALLYRNQMSKSRVRAVVFWILVWMLAAFVQFFNNQFLLVGYASSIGMMILFFKLENPEAALDRETGVFNSHTFFKYMRQLYEKGASFSVLLVRLEQHTGSVVDYSDAGMLEIARFLESRKKAKVFKGVEQEFMLLFETREQLEDALDGIRDRFAHDWNGRVYFPLYVTLPDSNPLGSAGEVYELLHYYCQHTEHMNDQGMIEINEKRVEERRRYQRMEEVICEALAEDRVDVFFQPIYSFEKDCFVSAEALARIRLEDGTIVPPGQFIAVAEATGLIIRLGERVFEKTCRFIQREKIWEWGLPYIEINLSVKQCESGELAGQYIKIMERYGVKPSMINLEVTESASIQIRHNLLQNMHKLIEYGVSFSLDDFGNGESNLNYIVDMPVQIVKFDRDMVRAYFEKDKGRFVMEAATRMILDMGLKIVSEGVESEEQLMGMKKLGVHYVQGYYFSRPLPETEFVKFISRAIA